jgi:hypothetical protein
MSRSGSFGVNYTKTFTTADEGLPAVVGDVGSAKVGEFIFVQADGAIDQYAFVKITDDGQAAMLTQSNDSAILQAGVAQVAAANDEYLWVWVGGVGGGGVESGVRGKVAASYAADSALYTTTSAGVADDLATAPAVQIVGAVGLTTDSGSGSAVELKSMGYLSINLTA